MIRHKGEVRRVQSILELERGDIVRHVDSGNSYVVIANYGEHATAVRSIEISDPTEWEIIE